MYTFHTEYLSDSRCQLIFCVGRFMIMLEMSVFVSDVSNGGTDLDRRLANHVQVLNVTLKPGADLLKKKKKIYTRVLEKSETYMFLNTS